jgi:hypothetical protein
VCIKNAECRDLCGSGTDLHLVSYIPPNEARINQRSEVVFKKRVNKTTFLSTLNSMQGINVDEKRDALLPTVT